MYYFCFLDVQLHMYWLGVHGCFQSSATPVLADRQSHDHVKF